MTLYVVFDNREYVTQFHADTPDELRTRVAALLPAHPDLYVDRHDGDDQWTDVTADAVDPDSDVLYAARRGGAW